MPELSSWGEALNNGVGVATIEYRLAEQVLYWLPGEDKKANTIKGNKTNVMKDKKTIN